MAEPDAERDPHTKLPDTMVRVLMRHLTSQEASAAKKDPDALRTTLAVARSRLRRELLAAEWRDD
jgi:hypothetical protein